MQLRAANDSGPDVRLVIRWDTRRKVWTITGSRGTSVVHEVARSDTPIDRTDLIGLVRAVRDELEARLPLYGVPPWDLEEVK